MIGLNHPKWVEAVVAVVVPKRGETILEQEIIGLCKKQLAPFKTPESGAVPRGVAQDSQRQDPQKRHAQDLQGSFHPMILDAALRRHWMKEHQGSPCLLAQFL